MIKKLVYWTFLEHPGFSCRMLPFTRCVEYLQNE